MNERAVPGVPSQDGGFKPWDVLLLLVLLPVFVIAWLLHLAKSFLVAIKLMKPRKIPRAKTIRIRRIPSERRRKAHYEIEFVPEDEDSSTIRMTSYQARQEVGRYQLHTHDEYDLFAWADSNWQDGSDEWAEHPHPRMQIWKSDEPT